jgi:hypothetical protein
MRSVRITASEPLKSRQHAELLRLAQAAPGILLAEPNQSNRRPGRVGSSGLRARRRGLRGRRRGLRDGGWRVTMFMCLAAARNREQIIRGCHGCLSTAAAYRAN